MSQRNKLVKAAENAIRALEHKGPAFFWEEGENFSEEFLDYCELGTSVKRLNEGDSNFDGKTKWVVFFEHRQESLDDIWDYLTPEEQEAWLAYEARSGEVYNSGLTNFDVIQFPGEVKDGVLNNDTVVGLDGKLRATFVERRRKE